MKLLSLHIDKYKNLSGDYDFTTQDGYIALIGENGSGKSNLLEAISLIFGKLYKISNIEDIGKFRIRYEIDDTEYSYGNIDDDGNDVELDANPRLPSSIISCYSGEDMRLWNSVFQSYYIDFFNKAIQGYSYIPKLLYINKYCWKIAFISLLYSENQEVKDFITNKLGINADDVKIGFSKRYQKVVNPHDAARWYDQVDGKLVDGEIRILDLKNIDLNETQDVNATIDQRIFYYLYFLSMPEKNPIIGLRADKLIENIKIKVDDNLDFDNLSEGEKKLILIECITKVLSDKSSLLLLDEPDAHTHIAKKKDILDAIELFEGQAILTTHSPMFANLLKDDSIFYINSGVLFDKNKSDIVVAISDNGIDVINGACIVSSQIVIVVEGSNDIEYLTKAIKSLKNSNPEYEQLMNIGFIPQGSADHTEAFYDDIVSKLPQSVKKIIYLFDNDKPGMLNADKIKDKPKVSTILYKPVYDAEYNHIYYIEDYIPTKYYPEQFTQEQLNLSDTGDVKYHQLKEILNLASDLKGKVTKIKNGTKAKIRHMDPEDFISFKPLLDQILKAINS